jgi:hypothetical protein
MQAIEKQCYALVQEVVVARDPFCRAPNCHKPSTAGHHIFSRSDKGTAFLTKYCVGLCNDCHVPWAHGEPANFRVWARKTLGNDEYELGRVLSSQTVRNVDYRAIRESLKRELNQYK